MKSIYTLVDDIYQLVTTKEVAEGVDLEKCIDDFGENMKSLMRKRVYREARRYPEVADV